ncbi:arginine-ornithine antiporter [Peribacillus sp. SCS-26]|uniref:arginine-ornithine antiporter n=1 Tax=Paraperibacillus marinus TaxID=3115295 RepID=UPI003905E160
MEEQQSRKAGLSLWPLIALVIGSVIGGGAFNLPSDIAQGAHSGAILFGWLITGTGIIALGLSFQNLMNKEPHLDGGVFAFARAGFGQFTGFVSAWGYWCSAFLGNVAFATLTMDALGYFFPVFSENKLVSIAGASVILWLVHFLVLQGVHSAASVNVITTIAKLIPILLFIILGMTAFKLETFSFHFWGSKQAGMKEIMGQVKNTMLITLWVFVGFEGAVVLSGRAKERRDVGRATVIGLVSTLLVYVLITIISAGIMSNEELAALKNPSLAYVFEQAVGKWGAAVVNIGLIVSVLGAWLGWTMLAAEIPFIAGREKVFPSIFSLKNKNSAPIFSLFLSNLLIQLFLLTFLFSEKPYQLAYSLASSAVLLPYFFAALYQVKHSFIHRKEDSSRNIIIGVIAMLYSLWLLYAAGLTYLLLTLILFLPGILVYLMAQKEFGQPYFKKKEGVAAAIIFLGGLIALYMLVTAAIQI